MPNWSAILFDREGRARIARVNLFDGLTVRSPQGAEIKFSEKQRNNKKAKGPVFYDLLYEGDRIEAKKRVVYRFVGCRLIEKLVNPSEAVTVIPVGLTITVPQGEDPLDLMVGDEIDIDVPGLENSQEGIEAGPLLVAGGKAALDMEVEGWKTANSIATQAARLDYTDMRGPKIAAGISKEGRLMIIAINGRIRESVGATHLDMIQILLQFKADYAMGFDPGGSVTLIFKGNQLNISPYNPNYESNIFSLPPTARTVGNAIIGLNKALL